MTNPDCLQTGATIRYADAQGRIHDALITSVISTADRLVNLQYDEGQQRVENVLYSAQPARGRWGCASDGAPHSWAAIDQV